MKGVTSFPFTANHIRVSFNQDSARTKTLKQFQEEQAHIGLTPEQLKEAWELMQAPAPKLMEAVAVESIVAPSKSK